MKEPIAISISALYLKSSVYIIEKDPETTGYSINDLEIKVGQFADDTYLFWTAKNSSKMYFGSAMT